MGALPPISPWIPQDDLLLKNAVEEGASLEALAKGAVRFSRRFTMRELQERWFSLLYDPDISVEAAEHMRELECPPSNLTFNKSSRVETLKNNRDGLKRKVKSVRRCYYAIRKRIRSDPLNQGDLNFLGPQLEDCYGHRDETACPNNILEDPMGIHFEIENTNFDGMHRVCPEDVGNNIDGASQRFDNGDKGQLENHPTEQCEEIPKMVQHVPLGDTSTVVGGIDSLKEIPVRNPFEDDLDVNTISNSDNNMNGNMYPCLEGNRAFNSPVSECEATFHHLQYSSPPTAMPVWKTMGTMSAMEMAGDSHLRGKNHETGDPFGLPDDARKTSSEYDVVHTETDFESHIACDDMKSSPGTQFDFVALSDTLLNFSDDDMLFTDDDGKEIDKYGLSNLLLDSPSHMNEDQMPDVTQVGTSVAPEADQHIFSSTSAGQLDEEDKDLHTSSLASVLEEPKVSSASDTNPQILELCNNVICCTLNTEDLEVPCNDHVIFPSKSRLTSLNRSGFGEISRRDLYMKDNLQEQASEAGLSLVNRELKRFGELHTDSQARGHKMGVNQAGEHDVNLQLPRTASFGTNSRHPGTASCSTVVIRTVASEILSQKQPCPDMPESAVKSSDGLLSHFETGVLGMKQEGQAVKKLEMNVHSKTADEMVPEAAEEPLFSDMEEQPSDGDDDDDDDIPYFSDIESMILDRDLDPEELESYSSRQVAIYQSEDAKRAINRLEQGAHAYMQRAIASHGAFAVLYGRHSKHYIKKPEVLLGRATEDVLVDIDLGKEGRANKISRRQAIIKLEDGGEFHLRNLGKCPILVDNKEVHPGHSLILHSNCLVEVREMPFIFVKNQALVKQYLDEISRNIPPN